MKYNFNLEQLISSLGKEAEDKILIEKLQKENEILKANRVLTLAKELNSDLESKKKNDDDLEALNKGWEIECKKKDKIIDLMAKYIDFDKMDFNCGICVHGGCQEECIKEYFEKKVEEK